MVPVAHQEDMLPHHRLIGQLGEVVGGLHHAEVDYIGLSQLPQLGHRGLVEHHLHVGVLLLKQGQHIGQEGGPPPGGHPDVEHRPLLEVPQVADQLPVQKALPLQIGVEQLPRRGELQRRVGAVQQDHPQAALQLGQVLAQVGLGEIQPLRRPGDAPLLDDGEEIVRVFDEHGPLSPEARSCPGRPGRGNGDGARSAPPAPRCWRRPGSCPVPAFCTAGQLP